MSTLLEALETAVVPGVPDAASWLDRRYPDWHERINLNEFSMEDSSRCIGHYLGVDWYNDLAIPYARRIGYMHSFFATFTGAWREQILSRRSAYSLG